MSSPRLEFRFGLSASTFAGVDALVDSAVRAEQAGFDSVTVPDLPGGLSPLVALATAARATNNIRLGTFVLNTGLWNPATVARELATLDQVSGGRLEIMLGSGIPQASLRGIIPDSRDGRFERLQATVAAVKQAFDAPGIAPGFVGRPRLLIAGTADRVLRLAADAGRRLHHRLGPAGAENPAPAGPAGAARAGRRPGLPRTATRLRRPARRPAHDRDRGGGDPHRGPSGRCRAGSRHPYLPVPPAGQPRPRRS